MSRCSLKPWHRVGRQLGRQLAPRFDLRGLVLQRLQQHRVGADQRVARAAAEVEVGVVHRHQPERSVLQRRREGRGPEHAQHLQRRPGFDLGQQGRRAGAGCIELHAQRQVAGDAPARQARHAAVGQRHAQRCARDIAGITQLRAQPVHGFRAQHRLQLRHARPRLGAERAHRRTVAETQPAQVVEEQQRVIDTVEQRRQCRARGQQCRRWQLGGGGTDRHRERGTGQCDNTR